MLSDALSVFQECVNQRKSSTGFISKVTMVNNSF